MSVLERLSDLVKRIGSGTAEEDLPDDVTRDKVLRSLRRERRVQMELVEKEQLRKKIADFKRQQLKTHLFGLKGEIAKQKITKAKNAAEILKQKSCNFGKGNIL